MLGLADEGHGDSSDVRCGAGQVEDEVHRAAAKQGNVKETGIGALTA
jgi:hypothetical protein